MAGRIVRTNVDADDYDDEPVTALIEELTRLHKAGIDAGIESDSIKVEIYDDHENHNVLQFNVYYWRPKTLVDIEADEAKRLQQAEHAERLRRIQWERLNAEFGGE